MLNLAHEFMTRGWSPSLAERARSTPLDEHGGSRPLSAAEVRRLDDWALLRSEWARDPSLAKAEREAVAEVVRRSAFVPDGVLVPFAMLRDFNAGTPSQAGNLSGHAPRLLEYAGDALRAAPVLSGLGVPVIAGFSGSPVLTSFATGPNGAPATEVASVAAGSATTRAQTLAPNRVSVVFPVSNQAFLTQAPAASQLLMRQILSGLAAELERQFFNGTGSGGELTGLRNAAGVGSVVGGASGATLSYGLLADLENAASTGVAEVAPGFCVNPTTRRFLRTLVRAAGLPFVWEGGDRPLLGHRAAVTANLPNNLTKGAGSNLSALCFGRDWSQAVVCVFGEGIGITLDRVTLADRGQTRVVASVYADLALIQPAGFTVMSDAATV
jgi:hypothetical protein